MTENILKVTKSALCDCWLIRNLFTHFLTFSIFPHKNKTNQTLYVFYGTLLR